MEDGLDTSVLQARGQPLMGAAVKSGPVKIALVGMGWWGQKMLSVLQSAPEDIQVVRAVRT